MTGTLAPRSTDGRETAIAALRVSIGVTVFSTQQPPRITLGITAEEVKLLQDDLLLVDVLFC